MPRLQNAPSYPRLRARLASAAFALMVGSGMLLSAARPAGADDASDRNAIAARLLQWTVAFNERRSDATCDIFAPDLIADFAGAPERGRAAICAQIATELGRTDQRMTNAPLIREIIVSGKLAVVRLVWRVTIERGHTRQTSEEPGIDVFRKEPDGKWVIIRYLAYSRLSSSLRNATIASGRADVSMNARMLWWDR